MLQWKCIDVNNGKGGLSKKYEQEAKMKSVAEAVAGWSSSVASLVEGDVEVGHRSTCTRLVK